MTYEVGARGRGWLWEHRAVVTVVCLLILIADAILVGSGLVPFLPIGMLLLGVGVVAALVVVALVLLWLSATASDLPYRVEPVP